MERFQPTPIRRLENLHGNTVYIKRDDLLPYAFGGNKARKAVLFFEEIDAGHYDAVVTYGSAGSNHCRVIANLAAARGLPCHIISTDGESGCLNRRMTELLGAEVTACTVDAVSAVIDAKLAELSTRGLHPYFIPGGGHGNTGTRAYDLAWDEIRQYEKDTGITFDYIFLASGTGTTQAGLICGMLRRGDNRHIVGISIARSNPRGRQVVEDSIRAYLGSCPEDAVEFTDRYTCGGYGISTEEISDTIRRILTRTGVPLDPTYTGKAYAGMTRYLSEHQVAGHNVLFLHTGGTPIFCDWLVEST